jgi:hypothetical protein
MARVWLYRYEELQRMYSAAHEAVPTRPVHGGGGGLNVPWK